jgi:DNA-directed RNA polymerase subunit RPC12/RpoP
MTIDDISYECIGCHTHAMSSMSDLWYEACPQCDCKLLFDIGMINFLSLLDKWMQEGTTKNEG